MRPVPMIPGVPAAGHVSRGFWHPGRIEGCPKCPSEPRVQHEDSEDDRAYNRISEHDAGEHVTSWAGCPVCEGDTERERYYRHRFGLETT